MRSRQLIVFDMDGVVIDVSRSYRDVVRQTVKRFFKGARSGADLPDPMFSLSDLAGVKQRGGLNNDWDLTFFVVSLLVSLIETPMISEDPDPWRRYRKTLEQCNVTALCRFLRSNPAPLTALVQKTGEPDTCFAANFFKGDVGSGNIIKQIFQEVYLGKDLFASVYGMASKFYRGKGYIYRERLLMDKSVLESLSSRHVLAVATGRPKIEADIPLEFFGLRKYFSLIYTLDDCIREENRILERQGEKVSLSKPNPYMLDVIAEAKKNEASRCFYVGDMPDDMVAASRSKAGYTGIGFLLSASDKTRLREDLLRAGADYIIEDFRELMQIFSSEYPLLPGSSR